ncbi:MAG: GNAT family N-acetyltransferase [Clostridium sp.]
MNHIGTVEIETERLLLRKFSENDVLPSYNNWTSDKKVTEFLRWQAHNSIDITKKVLNEWINNYKNKDFYQWAIVLKEYGNEPIGTISIVDKNESLNMVHIGYCIGSKWWKQGITSEAFLGIISFLFNKLKVNRIESQHDPRNPNSGKVMIKCGLTYEGCLRQADFSNKGIVDAAIYSILKSEYYVTK